MKKLLLLLVVISLFQILSSCKTRGTSGDEQMPVVSVRASRIIKGDIESEISFNGSTVYLRKNQIVSPISGYVNRVGVKLWDRVKRDEELFEIMTRESKALETDSSAAGEFGIIKVTASSDGFINEMAVNEPRVYVAEGGALCSIIDVNDLMVKVNIPFENNSVLTRRGECTIMLTDNTRIHGSVSRILPVVDEVNQTQTVLIRPATGRQLPENLNVTVKFLDERHQQVFLVTKPSLMTNETQSEFWIMRIEEGNMAVKIPVEKGIENDTIVEIMSPLLKVNDLVISEGAYGLPDSTVINIAD